LSCLAPVGKGVPSHSEIGAILGTRRMGKVNRLVSILQLHQAIHAHRAGEPTWALFPRRVRTPRAAREALPLAPIAEAQRELEASLECTGPLAERVVYVHVPFCRSLCSFCGYRREIPASPDTVREYAAAVRRQLTVLGARPWTQAGPFSAAARPRPSRSRAVCRPTEAGCCPLPRSARGRGPFVQRLEHILDHLPRRLGRQRAAIRRGECQFAVLATGDCPAALVDQMVMEGTQQRQGWSRWSRPRAASAGCGGRAGNACACSPESDNHGRARPAPAELRAE
jgi:hypothetical protein